MSYIHNNNFYMGYDSTFHRMRVEGLTQGILNFDFLPKINYSFLEGAGYASSTFYSDVFLYPAAVLHSLGMPLSKSIVYLLVLINFGTFISSYYSMYTVDFNKRKSFLFSLLYTFSTYRFVTEVARTALGETIALMFIPLAFAGIYHIIYKDSNKWYLLTIGMLGILLSNILSAVTFSFLIVLLMLFNLKKVVKQKTILFSLTKATLLTVCLASFYLFPMLEQMSFQELYMGNIPLFYVGETGQTVLQALLFTLKNNNMTANIGIVLMFLVMITCLLYKNIPDKITKQLLGISLILLFITTNLFPWDLFSNTPLNSLQFPWRFMSSATVVICWFISLDTLKIFQSKIGYISVLLFILSFNIQLQTSYLHHELQKTNQDSNHLTTWDIGGGREYLPTNSTILELEDYFENGYLPIYTENNGVIKNYTKDYNEISFDYNFKNPTEVTIPFIYYKGYVAENNYSEQIKTSLSSEDNGMLSVKLDGTGELNVKYKGTLVHKIANVISIISLVYFSFITFKTIKRKCN